MALPSIFPDPIDTDDDDELINIDVTVQCPYCRIEFEGNRDDVEQELFDHIWKLHEDSSIEFMLQNMYVPEHIKAAIFEELGPDYVSWLVDTQGELLERPSLPRPRKGLK